MVLIVPDAYLVSIRAESGGQQVVNVIGVRAPGNTAISVANAVEGAWKTTGGPLTRLPVSYQLKEIKAMYVGTPNGDIHAIQTTGAGAVTGPLATNASCALVTYGTGTRAKSERGRMYLGPLREGDIDSDGRTLSNPAAWTTAMQNFRTALNVNQREWAVLSRKYSAATPIVVVSTQGIIATQRRRIR